MNHFLKGFSDELAKLAAMPQSEVRNQFDAFSSVQQALNQTQGLEARSGLKAGNPTGSPLGPSYRSPTPLTTPNIMTSYIGEQ